MSAQLRTILLTVLTLSVFAIALVEISGISSSALFNKYGIGKGREEPAVTPGEEKTRTDRVANMAKTKISFSEPRHDFGTIKEGAVVKHSFTFRNTGTQPLMISKADASCGCTVPSFSKEPIAPGGTGKIDVTFNSANREGRQSKSVLVYSNAQQDRVSIGFDANVVKD